MDPRLLVVSRMFYEQQFSKKEIADRLRMSITHVSRLLKEAARAGVVKIIITAPGFQSLEVELKERFSLRDVVVASAGDEETVHRELGLAAARYFESEIRTTSDRRQSVGLGSGTTLFEMVSALEEVPRHLTIYSLSVWAERSTQVKSIDANTLVKILWFKSDPRTSEANRVELFFPDEDDPIQLKKNVREVVQKSAIRKLSLEIENLDNYFFSCSSIRKGSQLSELNKILGSKRKSDNEPIGDIVFNVIGSRGEHIPTQVEDLLFRVRLDTLRDASTDQRKRVVLVAGGSSKAKVIQAGLQARLFNVLITDNVTAEQLLRKGG